MLTQEELDKRLTEIETDMQRLLEENKRLINERESAYVELDSWVSVLAKLAFAKDLTVGLLNRTTVVIELPVGPISWEFAESEAHLYEALPNYAKPFEVIEKRENYIRIMNPGF